MRHDAHFVDELATRSSAAIGSMVPIQLIEPNPEQPRTSLGNLEELTASVREKGILEPILIRPRGNGRYQIISGERRFRAATAAGLLEVPAIELDVDDNETLEIALIENIQRKDLTPFEEAEGFQALQQRFGYTHEKISQMLGKSRTTITETLQLNEIPDRIKVLCREAGLSSKSSLVQISRAPNEAAMEEAVRRLASGDMTRSELRKQTSVRLEAARAGRPKNFKYELKDRNLPFRFNMTFKKSSVDRPEIIQALRDVIERLEKDE